MSRPRFWFAVERTEGDRASLRGALRLGIDHFTRALWAGQGRPTNWTFPSGPAGHVFVAYQDEGGLVRRAEAVFPRGTDSPWTLPVMPTAMWEVLPVGGVDPEGGVQAAKRLKNTLYDVPELSVEVVALLCPPVLASMVPWRAIAPLVICSSAACKALEDCGGQARDFARQVMVADHYPEEVGQAAVAAQEQGQPWLRRCHDLARPDLELGGTP